MPRKFITQEVKDQNRESQRRSRARRTELINDLKKQVQDYQRQGASASLEMQRMAQAVTFENQRLRSLLSAHGVSQEEIHRYISSPPALSPESPGERAKPQPPQSQEGNKSQCCGSRSNENDHKCSEKSSEVKPNLTTTHPLPKHIAPEATSPTDSMETSCDTAASILVDLHHHMDTEQARAALGCRGSESCNVSNIKIFQLLEKID
ncbi:hypothetical protein TrVFT333_007644 [Trichoderma virens FT-333]|nr:hypothetical protein TrVFT333_007644 [Trichoderma virens FT-333]